MRSSRSTSLDALPPAGGTLGIVIVNWNTGPMLRECLGSIADARLPAGWTVKSVVVVDNASSDGSADALEGTVVPLLLVRNAGNRGFAAACNQGAAMAETDLLLFLNPDTRLFPGSLEAPVRCMQSSAATGIGIVGVQLLDERQRIARTCSRFPRGHHFLCQALGLDRLVPTLAQAMLEWDHASTREVDQVMGAFFMTTRPLFDRLGGFDERFFVYFEEVDFARRALMLGWRSLYIADAQAFHLGGGSSRQVVDRRLMYSLRSRLLYAQKHFHYPERLLTGLTTLIVEPPVRLLHALAVGGLTGMANAWRGYRLLTRALLERKTVRP